MIGPGLMLPGGRLEEVEGIAVLSLVYGPDRTLGMIAEARSSTSRSRAIALVILSPLLLFVARARSGCATVGPSSSARRASGSTGARSRS